MIIVIMGVAGSGKTTIGGELSNRLRWLFFDGDDFHPPSNVEKMRSGIPLNDDDRWPWLKNLRLKMEEEASAGRSAVFACSALKQSYRDFLSGIDADVKLVYLKGDAVLIAGRLAARRMHFMREDMLLSQMGALEEPSECVEVDVSASPDEIAAGIIRALGVDRVGGQP